MSENFQKVLLMAKDILYDSKGHNRFTVRAQKIKHLKNKEEEAKRKKKEKPQPKNQKNK